MGGEETALPVAVEEEDAGDPEDDCDPDDREEEEPGNYWRAVRTRSQIDHDVGTGVLKPREGAFVIEYTMTPDDARGAAIRAGYAVSSAHVQAGRLMKRERVQRAIAREFARKAATTGVDSDYLVRQCRDIAEDHSMKAADRLRAIELMGKLVGAFAPEQVEHTHRGVSWADVLSEDVTEGEFTQVPDLQGHLPPPGDDNLG